MPEARLQKVLAEAGVASRRASETLIAEGRVRVNGKLAVIGQSVDPEVATIEVDGRAIGVGAARAYLALHKPPGVTSTTRDRHAALTVLDLIPTALQPEHARLYPVGRLDQDSEGLLLLTNDGDWAERVLHPRFGVEREYAVGLRAPLAVEQVRQLREGIRLDEGLARLAAPLRQATAVEARAMERLLDPPVEGELTWYRAVLVQGWKRQLRRMFGAVGAPIERLVRVRIGGLRLDGLPSGRARALKAPELRSLSAPGGAGSTPRGRGNGGAARRGTSDADGRGQGQRRPQQRPSSSTSDRAGEAGRVGGPERRPAASPTRRPRPR